MRCDGFTMIELVVTMAVAGILFAVGLPSLLSMVQNNRLSGQASSLVFSLNYARSEAIKRNKSAGITVCASSTGAACTGTWASGWIVLDPVAPLVLLATPALSNNNTLTSAATTLTFNPDGSASAAATYTFCDSRGVAYARDVEVSTLGSVQASQTPGKTVSGANIAGC